MIWRLPSVALLVLGLVLGVVAGAVPAAPRASEQVSVPLAGIREHLTSFQRIAEHNGGNRLAGTSGYDASAGYVARRMRAAGYRVRFQEFSFPFVFDRSPPVLRVVGAATPSFRAERDYTTLGYSGSGAVEARVVAVDLLVPSPGPNASTSGCEASDFNGFSKGAVALLQRGTCFFREKLANAVAAGASAVIVFNEGNPGRRAVFAATLGAPQASIPGLAASFELGDELRDSVRDGPTGVTVRVETDLVAERRRTRNVIAESRIGNANRLVVVGAHLDSVQRGPGINDNGSGSAVILEIAEQLKNLRPSNRLRFVWWGAEELGLLGSRHYVSAPFPGGAARECCVPQLRHGRLGELRPLRLRRRLLEHPVEPRAPPCLRRDRACLRAVFRLARSRVPRNERSAATRITRLSRAREFR